MAKLVIQCAITDTLRTLLNKLHYLPYNTMRLLILLTDNYKIYYITNYSKPNRPWGGIHRVSGGEGDCLTAGGGIQNALSSRRATPGRRRRAPSQGQSESYFAFFYQFVTVMIT